jgi:predicted ABC-type ATPase
LKPAPQILVLAGVNGAGKSSIAGVVLERAGARYYDPDRATHRYQQMGLPQEAANSRAWRRGITQLERAIAGRTSYAFETTLGGRTVTRHLLRAAQAGLALRVWYVGLASPELHIERVRARVARGGHDIPEERIRARWTSSRENLIRLLPHVSELALWDNSVPADLAAGAAPRPLRILYANAGSIVHLIEPAAVPAWAKPVVITAVRVWSA